MNLATTLVLFSVLIPDKGWFTIFRLYGPKKEFFDQTWKLNDVAKMK